MTFQKKRGHPVCDEKVTLKFNCSTQAIQKKTSVSGVAAGCFIKVRMGTFFFIFAKKIIFFKNGQYFPTKKKNYGEKKKIAASLLASKKDTRWTGNRSFF